MKLINRRLVEETKLNNKPITILTFDKDLTKERIDELTVLISNAEEMWRNITEITSSYHIVDIVQNLNKILKHKEKITTEFYERKR
jgi:hypothetical protein